MVDKNLKENRLHGDGRLAVSCYRIAPPFENYSQLECHWHSEMELFKVEKGRVQVQCAQAYFEAEAGDLVFVPGGALHAAQPLDSQEMNYTAVVFHPDVLCGEAGDLSRTLYVAPVVEGRVHLPSLVSRDTAMGQAILPHFDALTVLLGERPPAYELRVRARLLDIFCTLLESSSPREESGNLMRQTEKSSAQSIKDAIAHIRTHYQGQITVDQLAEVSHMSTGHFCRLFKKYTFKTPVQYINNLRLSRAMEMLMQSDRKVLDIALDTGFNSLSYFIGVFKQNLGCTPTEFRSQMV